MYIVISLYVIWKASNPLFRGKNRKGLFCIPQSEKPTGVRLCYFSNHIQAICSGKISSHHPYNSLQMVSAHKILQFEYITDIFHHSPLEAGSLSRRFVEMGARWRETDAYAFGAKLSNE